MSVSLHASTELDDYLAQLEKKPYFKQASLSLYAVAEKDLKILVDHNGEKSLNPNSILKLLTTAAALKILGKDFQFKTELLGLGVIKNHTLEGDLVILGDGDPALGSMREGSHKKLLDSWVLALRNQGIQCIQGSIVADASCFEQRAASPTWLWEDLGNYYGAGAFGLNFHENLYTVSFQLGSKLHEATTITHLYPSIKHLNVVNEVVSGSPGSGDQAYIFGEELTMLRHIRGTLPLDHPSFVIKGSMPNPPLCCAQQLKERLEKEGLTIQGEAKASFESVLAKDSLKQRLCLDNVVSSLSHIIFLTNKLSINLYAEALLKKVGSFKQGKGSYASGIEALYTYLKELGLPLEGFKIVDGSGLSTKNLVTAKGMVEFLVKLSKEPYYPDLLTSLPCNTSNDISSLKTSLSSEELQGRIFAKTGYSSHGESLAGIFINAKGERVFFCILCNHFLGPRKLLREEFKKIFTILDQS